MTNRSSAAMLRQDGGSGIDAARVNRDDLVALLEALLLVSPEPALIRDLSAVAGVSVATVEDVLAEMQADHSRGVVVVRHKDTAHLASAPRFAKEIRQYLKLERDAKLSSAALETLALVAYRQPVTRHEIESLRGVDCSGVLATLHARGLIEVAGKLPTVGNPNQYVTTIEFLRQFGLRSLEELPSLQSLTGRIAERVREEFGAPEPVAVSASTVTDETR